MTATPATPADPATPATPAEVAATPATPATAATPASPKAAVTGATQIAQVGVSQLCIGTDHPIPWAEDAVNHVLNTPGLSDADRVAILGGTATKLLGIKP